ncbi:MAG: hypothetical protein EBR09_03810 [Proteobacteria bacterium]|nr:hypothetical protein [Pseudomonadota bacterium]
MKKSLIILVFSAVSVIQAGESFAASNKDRVGLGSRKGEDQHPQAAETKQYCTEVGVKAKAGRKKESSGDEAVAQACQSAPEVRSAEESRAEMRKVERNPNN